MDTLIKKTWCTQFDGSFMFTLVNKCKLLKIKAKELNRTRFGNIARQINDVDAKLEIIQKRIEIDRDNINLQIFKIDF